MQQPETTLIYWAPSRVRFNLTLILAAAVILFGLYQLFMDSRSSDDAPAEPSAQVETQGEGEPPADSRGGGSGAWLLILVGLGVGAYSWLTSPRQYRVYSDALIIMMGTPRRRTIHFSDIREVANDRGFMGDPLRVYTVNRKRIPLQVREPEEMHRYLDAALADFRRANPQYAPPPEPESDEEPSNADVADVSANDTGGSAGTMSDATAGEPAANETADAPVSPPPDPAPDRSPRSRRRSLRDDVPSDGEANS